MIIPIYDTLNRIDIKTLAVDTNVLLWTFYGNITYVEAYQKNIYPSFLSNQIQNKRCKIYTTIYNICELFNVIEKNEYDLYLKSNSLAPEDFSRKKYRAVQTEREKLKKTFDLIYSQIVNCMEIVEYPVSIATVQQFKDDYEEHKYDIYDYVLLEFCKNNGIDSLLTDDADFGSYKDYIKDIYIITANKNLK